MSNPKPYMLQVLEDDLNKRPFPEWNGTGFTQTGHVGDRWVCLH